VLEARIALNLPSPVTLLYALLVITALLIAIIVARPSITVSGTGKMVAFVAFCVLPVLCGAPWQRLLVHLGQRRARHHASNRFRKYC